MREEDRAATTSLRSCVVAGKTRILDRDEMHTFLLEAAAIVKSTPL